MLAYRITNPRWPKVELRLCAYRPQRAPYPQDTVKVVIQACEAGRPIAGSPVAEETMTLLSLCKMLHDDANTGWERRGECPN